MPSSVPEASCKLPRSSFNSELFSFFLWGYLYLMIEVSVKPPLPDSKCSPTIQLPIETFSLLPQCCHLLLIVSKAFPCFFPRSLCPIGFLSAQQKTPLRASSFEAPNMFKILVGLYPGSGRADNSLIVTLVASDRAAAIGKLPLAINCELTANPSDLLQSWWIECCPNGREQFYPYGIPLTINSENELLCNDTFVVVLLRTMGK